MSEKQNDGITAARIDAAFDELETRAVSRLEKKFEEKLESLLEPREDKRIEVTESEEQGETREERRPFGTVQTRLATAPLYRQLHRTNPELKDVRTQESDHWVNQWLLGMATRNFALCHEGQERALASLPAHERAVWETGASTSGGVPAGSAGDTVPVPLQLALQIALQQAAKIPSLARSFEMGSGFNRIARVGQANVAMVAEGATIPDAAPPVTGIYPRANKMAGIAEITRENLADSAFNNVSLITESIGSDMGAEEDRQACTSDGSAPNISESIRADAGTGDPISDNGGALTFANVVATYAAVAQRYRPGGYWLANNAGWQAVTKIQDPSGSYPIFSTQNARPGAIVDDSAEGFIFGRPIYEVPLVGTTTTNGTGVLMYIGAGVYGWSRRQGMTAEMSDGPKFTSDVFTYKFTQRVEGIVLDPGATGAKAIVTRSGLQDFS